MKSVMIFCLSAISLIFVFVILRMQFLYGKIVGIYPFKCYPGCSYFCAISNSTYFIVSIKWKEAFVVVVRHGSGNLRTETIPVWVIGCWVEEKHLISLYER